MEKIKINMKCEPNKKDFTFDVSIQFDKSEWFVVRRITTEEISNPYDVRMYILKTMNAIKDNVKNYLEMNNSEPKSDLEVKEIIEKINKELGIGDTNG